MCFRPLSRKKPKRTTESLSGKSRKWALVSFEQILVDLLHSYERKSTKTSEVEDRPDRRPRMISIDFEAFVTDFHALSMLFGVLDSFLTDSDRKVLKSLKSLYEKARFRTNSICFCVLL